MNDEQLREKERSTKLFIKLQSLFKEDDVFWNNEIQANLFVSTCLLILSIVLVISYFLTYIEVFDVPIDRMRNVLIFNIPLLIGGNLLSAAFRGQKHWIKYVLCIISILTSIGLCSLISIFVPIIICIPVALSVRYYSRRFTNFVTIISIAGMAVSDILFSKIGILDLNLVSLPQGALLSIGNGGLREAALGTDYSQIKYTINLFRGSFFPKLLIFSIIATICSELSRRAHELVLDQEEISKKTEGVKVELEMAKNIQEAVLPKTFPAFPDRQDIDVRAMMRPAKEVGGDFYDYYFLDDDHLLLVIADVSGKGIPAALFMMISKMLIKTQAHAYMSPGKIAEAVNKHLCEDNKVDMFVTAWIGVLEISSGIVTAVDAGHEYPAILHEEGEFEYIKGTKSFVLAGMENSRFKEYSFSLNRGDKLFLYTDGIPEATDANNNLYGTEKLLEVLNCNKDVDAEALLKAVADDVDRFVCGAPQFDDLTMVALNIKY